MIRRCLPRLAGDRRGATIIEFAIISPVMALTMMGLGDLLYQMYAQSVLNGAVQKAARDSGIEGGSANSTVIDGTVITIITPLAKNLKLDCATSPAVSTWCSTRKTYDSFSQVSPEPLTDSNGNGQRDAGECFTDQNGNNKWDSDRGKTGQGGASAVALYTMSITYPRLFPVAKLFGFPSSQTISASSVLKNQPYATQASAAAVTNVTICT